MAIHSNAPCTTYVRRTLYVVSYNFARAISRLNIIFSFTRLSTHVNRSFAMSLRSAAHTNTNQYRTHTIMASSKWEFNWSKRSWLNGWNNIYMWVYERSPYKTVSGTLVPCAALNVYHFIGAVCLACFILYLIGSNLIQAIAVCCQLLFGRLTKRQRTSNERTKHQIHDTSCNRASCQLFIIENKKMPTLISLCGNIDVDRHKECWNLE